jgi:hypothetical protein
MPRQLSGSRNGLDKAETKAAAGATTPTKTNKRPIRWFVHPPSFSFHNNNNKQQSPATKRSLNKKSPLTSATVFEEEVREERAPRFTADSASSNFKRPWLSLSGTAVTLSSPLSNPPRTPPREELARQQEEEEDTALLDSPVVHRLQQELEEAKEQIKALEEIKELQEMEFRRQQQQQQQSPRSITYSVEDNKNAASETKSMNRTLAVDSGDVRQNEGGDDDDDSCASTDASVGSMDQDTSLVARQAARGVTNDLLEETDHPITFENAEQQEKVQLQPKLDSPPAPIVDPEDVDRDANYSLDPTFDRSGRANTPNSMTGPMWRELAFEKTSGIDYLKHNKNY